MMIVVTFIMLMKTFFFLRLFKQFSGLVTMMKQVARDLYAFMVFYLILLWMCSLVFNILELGNYTNPRDPELRNKVKLVNYPGIEYRQLPRFVR